GLEALHNSPTLFSFRDSTPEDDRHAHRKPGTGIRRASPIPYRHGQRSSLRANFLFRGPSRCPLSELASSSRMTLSVLVLRARICSYVLAFLRLQHIEC